MKIWRLGDDLDVSAVCAITDTWEIADSLAKLTAYRAVQAQQAPKLFPCARWSSRGVKMFPTCSH
jgi:hypothetical protein